MPQSRERRPWPMKWIVLAILLVIAPYTFLTLRYRKPGPAFQPYEDLKSRANVSRLLDAGYQRVSLSAERPADQPHFSTTASSSQVAGGLPEELKATLIEPPLLPLSIQSVLASPRGNTLQSYPIQISCTLVDEKQQPSGADLYLKENTMVIVPTFERVAGDLRARSSESRIALTLPAGTLKPGSYHATVVGAQASRQWSLEIR
jgi:hypothetical protein